MNRISLKNQMKIAFSQKMTLGYALWFIACVVAILLPPVNDLPRFALLTAALLTLFFSDRKASRRKMAGLSLAALALVLLRLALPIASVQESHHIFITQGNLGSEPWRDTIPAPILRDFAEEFDKAYPLDKRCNPKTYGCWQFFPLNDAPVGWSADNFWARSPSVSRSAREIAVDDLLSARVGAFNNLIYNWYNTDADGKPLSDVRRDTAPFWVSYNLPLQAIGGKLCWKGLLWTQEGSSFEKKKTDKRFCEDITKETVQKTIWMGFLDSKTPSSIHLDWPQDQKLWRFVDLIMTALGVIGLLFFAMRPRWRDLAIGAALLAASLGFFAFHNPSVLLGVIPYSGGDDGLVHSSYAREIVQGLFYGDWHKALRGGEDVYYFMPGLRYVIVLEHLLFGEMRYIEAYAVLFLPLLLWRILKQLGMEFVILPLLGVAFFLPQIAEMIGLSYPFYVRLANRAMAEPMGYVLFLSGILVAIRNIKNEETSSWPWFFMGLLWAGATFIRPNLVLASGAGLLYGLFVNRQHKRHALALIGGYAAILVCLLHNLAIGGQAVLLTSAGTHPANFLITPQTYAQFVHDFFTHHWGSSAVLDVRTHIGRWIGSGTYRFLLFALLPLFLILEWREVIKDRIACFLVCVVAGLQLPLFFFHPDGRYAMLAWLVSFLLLLRLTPMFLLRFRKAA